MSKKYYLETKNQIETYIQKEEYENALKLINEELGMPYIPLEFENYLVSKLETIPLQDKGFEFSLDPSKIIEILLNLDIDNNDEELIIQLSKFNLNEYTEDLEHYFINSDKKRSKAILFDLLVKMNINITVEEFGDTKDRVSIEEDTLYMEDVKLINEEFDKFPTLIQPGIKLLKEIHLTKYYGQEINESYVDVISYTLSKLFDVPELEENIKDINKLKNKLENYKTIDNI